MLQKNARSRGHPTLPIGIPQVLIGPNPAMTKLTCFVFGLYFSIKKKWLCYKVSPNNSHGLPN